MKTKSVKKFGFALWLSSVPCGALAASPAAGTAAARPAVTITWVSSNAEKPWQQMSSPAFTPAVPGLVPEIRIEPNRTYQTIDGFGACFNELGWVALSKASEAGRQQVIVGLFGDDGNAFNLARIPIGASDFALDGYSLDDTAGDYNLENFSIDRDKKNLIPFVKAAMAVRPALQSWGSPWSPPAWMKTNKHYSGGALKQDPAVLKAYANYLARWVAAYRREGVSIYAITPQNEPNIANAYPTCLWTGPELREFIAEYLGPTLRDRKPNIQLWLGLNGDPPNNGDNVNDRLVTVMGDPSASSFITGIGFQYDSRNQIAVANELFPGKKLMQSETACFNGANSWPQAQELFGLMKRYFEGGANAYFAWNMVLGENGMSTWNWRQNALITVNQATGHVTYNGEYYVLRHFSHYVKPGAKRVLATGVWGDKVAFVNPDGSTVLVIGNSLPRPFDVTIAVAGRADGQAFRVTLPVHSVNTFAVPAPNAATK